MENKQMTRMRRRKAADMNTAQQSAMLAVPEDPMDKETIDDEDCDIDIDMVNELVDDLYR